MATLLQSLIIGFALAQVALIIAALIHLRRQALTERELLLWDVITVFVPFGAFMVFIYFPFRSNQQK